jgi:hypothetical protein
MANLRIEPLTRERFCDLVSLFSRPGLSVARNCFCMFYRRSGRHERPEGMTYGEANQRAMKALVAPGSVPMRPLGQSQRRLDVVRCEVDVRSRRLRRGRPSQASATSDAQEAARCTALGTLGGLK